MSQAGYTPISLYYSTTASAVPVNTNLANGELAINITDGKLYYKDNTGTVTLLAQAPSGGGTFAAPVVIEGTTTSDALRITQLGTGNALLVEDSANPDSTPFVINASGNTVIGSTTAPSIGGAVRPFSVVQTNSNAFAAIARYTADTGGSGIVLQKSRGTTVGDVTTVQSGDFLGTLYFAGSDGTSNIFGASISAAVDNTPGTNDMPGRLTFGTTADGASSPTERMRIDSAGNLALNTTSTPLSKFGVNGNAVVSSGGNVLNAGGAINFAANGVNYSPMATIKGVLLNTSGTEDQGGISFQTRPNGVAPQTMTERMRIDSSGNVGIGTTAPETKLHIKSASTSLYSTVIAANKSLTGFGTVNYTVTDINTDGTFAANQWLVTRNGGVEQYAYMGAVANSAGFAPDIVFGQRTAAAAMTERMRIDSSGNVGIGTSSPAVKLAISSTDAILIPAGTTAQQPTGVAGYLRFNTTTSTFEGYNGTAWSAVGGGSALSNDTTTATNLYPMFAAATSGTPTTVYTSNAKYLYKPSTGELQATALVATNGIVVNSQTVSTSYTIASGNNGLSAGTVSVATGVTVTVSTGSVWTVV